MNVVFAAIASLLLAQLGGQPDRYNAQVRPKAQGVPIHEQPPGGFHHDGATQGQRPQGEHNRGAAPAHAATDQTEPSTPMSAVEGAPRPKLRPPELLAEALEKPNEGALVGTPLTLERALARASDRQQQLRIAQAYWRLSTAQADYHWALDNRDRLARYTHAHSSSPATHSARAAARADVRDMQLAVAHAQQDLIDAMGYYTDPSPPLAVDRPHVGDYRTFYETIYANRPPPPRIRLIHRTLPVLRQAIDAHGEAIVAVLDALEAPAEQFEHNGQGIDAVLSTLDLLKRERRTFMADVRNYNQDIAEYALATAPAGTQGQALVARLILTPSHSRNSGPAAAPRAPQQQPLQPQQEPPAMPAEEQEPEVDPLRQNESDQPQDQTTNYQPSNHNPPAHEAAPLEGLLNVTDAPQRVQRLANLLHWDRTLPPEGAGQITLAECLEGRSPSDRLAMLATYWRARERAARYQALNEQVEHLNQLPPIATALRNEPGFAEAGVRVQAARRAAKAAVFDEHVALIKAEFELTQAAGRRLDEPWLLPITAPQSGRYSVVPSKQNTPANARAAHWAEMLRLEHAKLEERADAVIQADVDRAALVNELRDLEQGKGAAAPAASLDTIVIAIDRENQQTLAFLADLTAYNIAIAHYAMAEFPASISGDELVRKLVIPRSTRRDT